MPFASGCIVPAMGEEAYVEPSAELLARATAAAHHVSETQLARWHRAGLLSRPRRRSLGRGRGTQTLYRAGTGDQLLALCEIHKRHKKLETVGWQLWWRGFPV